MDQVLLTCRQLHHIIPRKEWWRMEHYPLEWVVTLCTDCHNASDKQRGVIKWPRISEETAQTKLDEYC
ncbi:MAG: HNH endonuclease [Candidatus Odinarchaeota archaeon]